jgi:hypothetical protein
MGCARVPYTGTEVALMPAAGMPLMLTLGAPAATEVGAAGSLKTV